MLRWLMGILVGLMLVFAGCLGDDSVEDPDPGTSAGDEPGGPPAPPPPAEFGPVQEESLAWQVGLCEPLATMGLLKGINHDQVVLEERAPGLQFAVSFNVSGEWLEVLVTFFDEAGEPVATESDDAETFLMGEVPEAAHWAAFYSCGGTDVTAEFVVFAPMLFVVEVAEPGR